MIRLLRYLFMGDAHVHQWDIHYETKVKCDGYYHSQLYVLKCSCCGTLKRKSVRA